MTTSIQANYSRDAQFVCKQAIKEVNDRNTQKVARSQEESMLVSCIGYIPETSSCLSPARVALVDQPQDALLAITQNGDVEPIDIVGLDSGGSPKSVTALADEIDKKVHQHLAAKKAEGIIFSSEGTKFDTNPLSQKFVIDQQGRVIVNDCRVLIPDEEKGCRVLRASNFHSYTILRCIEQDQKIGIVDENALDQDQLMWIEAKKTERVSLLDLTHEERCEAASYRGEYVRLTQSPLSPNLRQLLRQKLSQGVES